MGGRHCAMPARSFLCDLRCYARSRANWWLINLSSFFLPIAEWHKSCLPHLASLWLLALGTAMSHRDTLLCLLTPGTDRCHHCQMLFHHFHPRLRLKPSRNGEMVET